MRFVSDHVPESAVLDQLPPQPGDFADILGKQRLEILQKQTFHFQIHVLAQAEAVQQGDALSRHAVTAQQHGDFAQLLVGQRIVLAKNGDGLLPVKLQAFPDSVDIPAEQLVQAAHVLCRSCPALGGGERKQQNDAGCKAER
ncbi:hypothetical protein D3C71_1364890 [compost metagenome]